MSIIAIRHGLSEANNRENYGTPAFDNPDSPLMPAGREQAIKLGERLVDMLNIQLINEPVAISTMRRSQETATLAGFRQLTAYPELNEEKGGLSDIEIVKGTGIERTWPNLMTREGVMGQEYEGGAVIPEHTTILPFTRLLAGPLDYTPGLFNLKGTSRKVQTTLAKQLAFYITMYSPMQMAADIPEHYINQPAFQLIRDVPVNWEQTIPLDGVIGDYYVVARKDRASDDWYAGGVSDEHDRIVTIKLDFLHDHRSYDATIYRDAETAHWQENPEAIEIDTKKVSSTDSLNIFIAPGGGFAIKFTPEGMNSPLYPPQSFA